MKVIATISAFLAASLVSADEGAIRGLRERHFAVAMLHGIEDTCFRPQWDGLAFQIKDVTGADAKCVPLGDDRNEDIANYRDLSMNEQVDELARRIKADPLFANGVRFYALSHGTLLARGYIQRYSWRPDFPVADSLIAVHGPMQGIGRCPSAAFGSFCSLVNGPFGPNLVYSSFGQNQISVANYLKLPCAYDRYVETEFLPQLNKETDRFLPEVGEVKGLDKLRSLVLVKADRENTIVPPESSWFGQFKDGSCNTNEIEDVKDTFYYQQDLFGLKTLDERGALFFERTPGGHVAVSTQELRNLVGTYWN